MLDFLKKIFSGTFSFSKKNESVVGIEIGSSSIKVVQLKKRSGRAILETYGEIALGPYGGFEVGQMTNLPEDKIVLALNDLIREARVTTKRAALSIPFSSSLVSIIELPKVSDKELETMVPVEARKYIPVPINEVSLDWFVIPEREESFNYSKDKDVVDPKNKKIRVLVVAIHKDSILRFENIVKKAQLEAEFFEVELFSTIRAVTENDNSLLAIIDVSASNTKVTIIERGVVLGSHIINKGSQDITIALSRGMGISIKTAEEAKRKFGLVKNEKEPSIRETILLTTDYIFSEINRILLNHERKFDRIIKKVILTGGGSIINGFTKEAKKNIEAEVIEADPFRKVEAPAFLAPILKEAGPEFAVAIGLSLRALQD